MSNVSVENANGKAELVTDATAKPKKDYKRKPGESGQDYLKRLQQEGLQRPGSAAEMPQKAQDLQDMNSAIQSDPDYNAWQQNISPDAYHNPTSASGFAKNDVLTGHNSGVGNAIGKTAGAPYTFAGADGNIYSGNASAMSGIYQPSGVKATQGSLSQQYSRLTGKPDPMWAEQKGDPKTVRISKGDQDLGGALGGGKFQMPSGPMSPPGWD
jgi:hypothetical protein